MKPTHLYYVAAALLMLFAFGHTVGFLTFKPASSEGLAVLSAMDGVAFDFEGNPRTYGGFYVGFGLTVTAYLVFSAFLAGQLGRFATSQPRLVAPLTWALVAVQLVSLTLSVRYFFLVPTIFSTLVIACLVAAALLTKRAAA